MRPRWLVIGGVGLFGLGLGLALYCGRPPAPPPLQAPPTIAERPKEPQEPTSELTVVVQAVLAQQAEILRLMQSRPGRDDAQSSKMQLLLLQLLNQERERRGEAPVSPTATPEEISSAIAAQGGIVLPERVVASPCKTKGRMHGVIPARGAEWELIPEWDPCPPEVQKRPWLDFSSGTLYSLKLGGTVWGNANLTLAEELAAAQLSFDSTRAGWFGEGSVEHIWMSGSGRFWHGVGVSGGYQDSTAGDGWVARAYYSPKLWVPTERR